MDVGGIEMFLMNYYRNIDRNVIQFDFCIVEKGKGHFDDEIRSLGGIIYNLPSKRKHPIRHLIELLKVLKFYRIQPVHMHLDGMNGLYGIIALLNNNKLRISHSHNTNHLTSHIIKRPIHEFFRLLNRIVNNHYAACSIEASIWLHGGEKTLNAKLISNAIDTNKFEFDNEIRNEFRERYGISNETVIGHVGRFHPQKNHRFIFDIAMELKALNTNHKFVFVGDGILHDKIASFITNNGLDEKFILIGKTDTPEKYYNMFDLFILPSLYEGLGISLIEAQSNGLPCLVSENVPSEAILSSNARIIPLIDLSFWIGAVLDMPTKRINLINNPFDITINSPTLMDYYRDLI